MAGQDDLSVHVPVGYRNKKFPGQQKREEIKERYGPDFYKMPDNEQKLQEYLDRMQHRQDGSALTFPNSLPPKMKELLAELAMVEKEITRLESQINQLKAEAKHEKEVHMESKSKEWERGTLKNHHESSPLPPDPNTICRRSNEVAFEIKALRFISKAIKEDHKLSDFSINEKAMNSRRFSTQTENTFC